MAPSASGNKSKQNARKGFVQPVLPTLPLQSKSRKAKPGHSETANSSPLVRPPSDAEQEVRAAATTTGISENDSPNTFLESSERDASGSNSVVPERIQPAFHSTAPQELAPSEPSFFTQTEHSNVSGENDANPEVNVENPALSNQLATSTSQTVEAANSAFPLTATQYQVNGVLEWADEVAELGQDPNTSQRQLQDDAYPNGTSPEPELTVQIPESELDLKDTTTSDSGGDSAPFANGALQETRTSASDDFPSRSQVLSRDDVALEAHSPTFVPTITEHLLTLATTKMWADWVIMVHARGLQPFVCYAHGLVLTRSLRLQRLMERPHASTFAGNTISLFLPRAVVPHAFEAAVRFFYSDAVLSSDVLFPQNSSAETTPARAQLLDYIISYWIAGIELGALPVVTQAASLMEKFVDWDVAELATKEAVDLTMAARLPTEDQAVELDYTNVGTAMLRTVLRFLATHINAAEFKLDTATSSTFLRSRFATLEDPRPKHNPALASMVFGSMPSSANMSPSSPQSEILPAVSSFADSTASRILINLDHKDLEYFCGQFTRAQGDAALYIVREVVEERESRRLKIVTSRTIPNKQRMANSVTWDLAGYREFVNGGQVQRERVGFLLPTKH